MYLRQLILLKALFLGEAGTFWSLEMYVGISEW